jgi:outer membrane protein
MNHRIACIIACAFTFPMGALAQSGSVVVPSAPPRLADKIGIVSIQSAIIGTTEGQKDLQTLAKKFDPKKNELKSLGGEIDGLKKQLEAQGPKLNDETRATLSRQIEMKQKTFSRAQEDAQNDFAEQQNELAQRILQKLLPVIDKYANDSGLTLVVEASKPWPDSPVLWARPSIDITKAVVDIYNAQATASLEHRPSSGNLQSGPEKTTQRPTASSKGSEPPK